jgi:hypothetical protein
MSELDRIDVAAWAAMIGVVALALRRLVRFVHYEVFER